ncbi:MAG: gamma carbonic anhydrase family protein [Euryarchaeota archaeon]|nr:gamma carbonic anhydrase family protein [Euryarchaeota archaeon]
MIYKFGNKKPSISESAFIADTACIIGDVSIGDRSSVWFNSVIRGDSARISIGNGCSIQDNAVIHTDDNEVKIGDGVIIGHGCVVHGRLINNNALIPPNYKVHANTVVMGVPCKEIRKTNEEDIEIIRNTLKKYEKLTEEYLKMKG